MTKVEEEKVEEDSNHLPDAYLLVSRTGRPRSLFASTFALCLL